MDPVRRDSISGQNDDARVVQLKHSTEAYAALSSVFPWKKAPTPPTSLSEALELITRTSDVMDRMVHQSLNARARATKYFETLQAELLQAHSECAALKEQLASAELYAKELEYRAREADLRTRELDTELGDVRQKLAATTEELGTASAWLARFQSELTDRFTNAARVLEDMGGWEFPDVDDNPPNRAPQAETH